MEQHRAAAGAGFLSISVPPTCPVDVKWGESMGFCPFPPSSASLSKFCVNCFSGRVKAAASQRHSKQLSLIPQSPEHRARAELLLSPCPAQPRLFTGSGRSSCWDVHTELLAHTDPSSASHTSSGHHRGTRGQKLSQSQQQGLTQSPYTSCEAGSSSGSTRLSRAPSSGCAASAPAGFPNPKRSTGVSQALRSLSLGSTKEGTEGQISSGQSQGAATGGQGRAGGTGGHQAMPANRTCLANTGLPAPQRLHTTPTISCGTNRQLRVQWTSASQCWISSLGHPSLSRPLRTSPRHSALSAILTLLSKLQMEVLAGMLVPTVLLHLRSTERRDKASTSSFTGREKERMLSWEAGTK